MTAATMQQTPLVPPRPSRPSEKDSPNQSTSSLPQVPPRPVNKRLDRSVSPGIARFAQSPLNEHVKSPKHLRFSSKDVTLDPIERPSSVNLPSVGEEGMEYNNVANDIQQDLQNGRAISPEHTRTVGDELHLHAPKASLPAIAAKRQVMQVTRTDSDKAAQFGLGRENLKERSRSREAGIRKRPSTSLSNHSDHNTTDDEHGIPEIGQRVPMNRHLGDVQAPSPAPSEGRHHSRRHSARNCPPGSYGLHGHGSAPLDRLDQDYYQKHPQLKEKEQHNPLLDRQNDYAMSREDLNKLVRDTPNRHSHSRLSGEYRSTPTDEAAFQVTDRYASRMSTPHDSPAVKPQVSLKNNDKVSVVNGEIIHVDDPRHPEYRSYGDEDPAEAGSDHDHAPILAADEVQKDSHRYLSGPAVHPAPERHGSAFEETEVSSRPTSRPHSLHKVVLHPEYLSSTQLDDVDEYEPLFEEEKEKHTPTAADELKTRRHFPSKDIWEDAPESVHYLAEVHTPEPEEYEEQPTRTKSRGEGERSMTPAQAFAQHQEELAEKEARGPAGEYFTARSGVKPKWIDSQTHLNKERPASSHRFPSRDIWEDVPESQLQSATVTPSPDEVKPPVPSRPTKKLSDPSEKPSIPERPGAKQTPSDESKTRPPVSDKPKPQVPVRPTKSSSGDSADGASAKSKPLIPNRMGNKIAALQAGFMSDLNKKLGLGPQSQKKEEPQEPEEEQEKAPLSDARKGRARGPQRRAPAKSAVSTEPANPSKLVLTFSLPQTSWAIDPDQGAVAVDAGFEEETGGLPSDEPAAGGVETAAIHADKAGESVHVDAPAAPAVSTDNPVLSEEPPHADEIEGDEDEDVEREDESEQPATTAKDEGTHKEQKTLVANTAGESILEAEVQKKNDEVEPVEVKDDVKA